CGSRCTSSGTRRCRRSATGTSTGSGRRRRSSTASTRRPNGRASTTSGSIAETIPGWSVEALDGARAGTGPCTSAVGGPGGTSRGAGEGSAEHNRRLTPLGRWRMTGRTYRTLAVVAAVIGLIIGVAGSGSAQKKGGTIRVGNLGEPPTLDAHWTTASITETLTNHIYEGLLTLDDQNKPIPVLAESLPAVSPDGLPYTFKLRHGIKFHNGKEMTSEDVVASLLRWSKQSIYGKDLFNYVAEGGLRGVDKYTVELKLKEKVAIVNINLAVA